MTMKQYIQLLFLIVWLVNPQMGRSQHCTIHLDKPFYATGENIWFKVYLPASFENQQMTLKVSIMGTGNTIIDYSYFKTLGRTSIKGTFNLPLDIPSSTYQVVVSGIDWAAKKEIILVAGNIPIYNDLAPASSSKAKAIKSDGFLSFSNDLNINIIVDKASINHRASISVKVIVSDENGRPCRSDMSVAVSDWVLTGGDKLDWPNLITTPSNDWEKIKLADSIFIQGVTYDTLGQPMPVVLLGGYLSLVNHFAYENSSSVGDFLMALPDFYGEQPFQLVNYLDVPIKSEIIQRFQSTAFSKSLPYPETIENYLTYSRQRKKLQQLFEKENAQNVPSLTEEISTAMDPNAVYKISEYSSFKDIPTFFRELVTPLKFRYKKKKGYTAKIFNSAQNARKFFSGPPLFIIDGIITRDANFVAELEIQNIDRIEIFNRKEKLNEYFGPIGVNGAVLIFSKKGISDYPVFDFANYYSINGLQVKKDFIPYHPDKVDRHEPVFQPLVYWNSSLSTDEQGEASFSFFQTDDLGVFQIQVVAQDEKGRISCETFQYSVKQ